VTLTDNSDSIVTVLVGTLEVTRAGRFAVTCRTDGFVTYQVGGRPEPAGALQPLVYGPRAVLWTLGILPGLLMAGWTYARRR
jgi:hypothetical protein